MAPDFVWYPKNAQCCVPMSWRITVYRDCTSKEAERQCWGMGLTFIRWIGIDGKDLIYRVCTIDPMCWQSAQLIMGRPGTSHIQHSMEQGKHKPQKTLRFNRKKKSACWHYRCQQVISAGITTWAPAHTPYVRPLPSISIPFHLMKVSRLNRLDGVL